MIGSIGGAAGVAVRAVCSRRPAEFLCCFWHALDTWAAGCERSRGLLRWIYHNQLRAYVSCADIGVRHRR